jgi:hypothetical protein
MTANARATVFTNTVVANFGSIGAGACRGGAVGVSGYAAGQVITAHPTGIIEPDWSGKVQVTAVPGPAPDQVGYKACNVGASGASAPSQSILLAAITPDSGQSTAVVAKDFGAIGADACVAETHAVSGAQASAAATAQPNAPVATSYGASGGLQVTAMPGSADNQITLKVCNLTAAAIDPPSQTFLLGSFPAALPGAATNTSALSYGSLDPGRCFVQSFGIPGAASGDAVIASPISPVATAYRGGKLVVTSLSTGNETGNEGSYKVCNVGAAAVSAPQQSFRVMAVHPPQPPCDPLIDFSCPGSCDPLLDPACEDPCAADPLAAGCMPSRPACGGRKATIVGSGRADVLKGTKKRDVILGRGGKDTVIGAGGGDLLCGGAGGDKLLGGAGDDKLLGGDGSDRLAGGKGDDRCDGGRGKDRAAGCKKLTKIP